MSAIAGVLYPDQYQVKHLVDKVLRCNNPDPISGRNIAIHRNIEVGTSATALVSNSSETLLAGLNGFFDNRREVIKLLTNAGYQLQSDSDEELLLSAYDLLGSDCLSALKGSFSFFIVDKQQDKLLLARDTTGKRSLYWSHYRDHVLFSSHLRGILASGLIPQTANPEAFASYLYFGYLPQDMTPVMHVNKLLPGHYLEIKGDGSININSFWSYSSFFRRKKIPYQPEALRKKINAIVSDQISNLEPVGCFISGGLGSASIAYFVNQHASKENIRGYSVGYKGLNDEDVELAREVASHLKIPESSELLTPSAMLKELTKILWYLDEPLADPTVTATWHMARLAARDVRVVFSGMGCDEIFAGHTRYTSEVQNQPFITTLAHRILYPFARMLVPFVNFFSNEAALKLLKYGKTNTWQYDYLQRNALFETSILKKAAPKLADLFDPELFLNKFYNMPTSSQTSSYLYFDMKTRLADLYTLQYQKLTSAHKLKWFSPFLQRDLIEFAATLEEPDFLKQADTGKYLKEVIQGRLPQRLIDRPKVARINFMSEWLEKTELPDLFALLLKGKLIESGFISQEWLSEQLSSAEKQKEMFRYLWSLLTLEVWYRMFLSGAVVTSPPESSVRHLLEQQ